MQFFCYNKNVMFMKNYKPTKYYKNILSIDYIKLKNNNIKTILCDLDNTILNNYENNIKEEIIELFKILNKEFKIYIISNALPSRVNKIKKELNVEGISLTLKPLTFKIKKLLKNNNININETIIIGDQLFTDIKCANKLNIKSILVDPLDKKKSIITKISRKFEKKYLKRGEYYE